MSQSITLKLWEHGDVLCCRLVVPFKPSIGGSVSFLVTLDSKRVLDYMRKAGFKFPQGEHVGSLFGAIGRAIKKVGKLPIIKQAVGLGKALVSSPLGNLVAPGAALAIKAASGAAKLVAASKSKNPTKAKKAKLALAAAKAQAKAEEKAGKPLPLPGGVSKLPPVSQAAFRYLVTVDRMAA